MRREVTPCSATAVAALRLTAVSPVHPQVQMPFLLINWILLSSLHRKALWFVPYVPNGSARDITSSAITWSTPARSRTPALSAPIGPVGRRKSSTTCWENIQISFDSTTNMRKRSLMKAHLIWWLLLKRVCASNIFAVTISIEFFICRVLINNVGTSPWKCGESGRILRVNISFT